MTENEIGARAETLRRRGKKLEEKGKRPLERYKEESQRSRGKMAEKIRSDFLFAFFLSVSASQRESSSYDGK